MKELEELDKPEIILNIGLGLNNNPSAANDLFSLPSSDPVPEHKNPPAFDMGLLDSALPAEETVIDEMNNTWVRSVEQNEILGGSY